MKNTSVCIFTETYYPVVGGGETQAWLLAEALLADDFQVIILTRRSDPSLPRIERLGGVLVYRLPPSGSGQLSKWGLLISSFPALIRLRHDYDLLFVSGFRRVGIAAVLAAKLLSKACILKADSLGEMSGDYFAGGLARLHLLPASDILKPFLWLRNAILKRADAFVAISSAVATEFEANGVSQMAIRMIPNGVDTQQFSPVAPHGKVKIRQRLGVPITDRVVIYTGRLVSYKGLPLLLRVWRDIVRKHDHTRLLLVGSGGLDIHNCEAELKEYVSENGLQNSVQFTGGVNNVHEYLQASDIFVFPSVSEAFGISLIEAMACGLAVVATRTGGLKDILEPEQNGLAVEADNPDQLRDALDTLLANPTLRSDLGMSARQTARRRYAADMVVSEYEELFRQKMIGRRGQ